MPVETWTKTWLFVVALWNLIMCRLRNHRHLARVHPTHDSLGKLLVRLLLYNPVIWPKVFMNGAFHSVNTCRRTCREHIHEREYAFNRKWKQAVSLYQCESDKVRCNSLRAVTSEDCVSLKSQLSASKKRTFGKIIIKWTLLSFMTWFERHHHSLCQIGIDNHILAFDNCLMSTEHTARQIAFFCPLSAKCPGDVSH